MLSVQKLAYYAECHYACECLYAECRYVECRSASQINGLTSFSKFMINKDHTLDQ
jgi:hypothetical protein